MILSIILRLLPFAIPLVAFIAAEVVNSAMNCSSIGKRPEPCFALGQNIGPYLGRMFWFGILLWIPGLIASGQLLSRFLRDHLPPPWGQKSLPSSGTTQTPS